MRKDTIDLQTLSGTSGSALSKEINGKILSIKVYTEAEITLKITTSACPISEYIFGTSGEAVTLAAGSHALYPRIEGHLASTGAALAAANKTNVFQNMTVFGKLNYAVTGTDTKTWRIEVHYED